MIKNIKILITLLTFGSLLYSPAMQAAELPIVKDLAADAQEAKQKQVPILVLFMSSTCPYCESALHDYLLPMQRDREYDSKVILRQLALDNYDKVINFKGKPTTQHLFSKANKIFAVPTVVLYDSDGNELTRITGLLTMDYYLAYLDNAINESRDTIKAAKR